MTPGAVGSVGTTETTRRAGPFGFGALAVLALLVLAAGNAGANPAGNATGSDLDGADGDLDMAGLTATVSVSLADGEAVEVSVSFTGSDGRPVGIRPPERASVTDPNGFEEVEEGAWAWRGDGTVPQFNYTIDADTFAERDEHGSGGDRSFVGDGWAVLDRDDVEPDVGYRGSVRTRPAAPAGYAGSEYALLDDYETATANGADGPLTVVVADSARPERSPGEIADLPATVTRQLNVSDEPQATTLFVVPAGYDRAFGFADGDELAVRGDSVWDGLLTHEYLHTRQDFETAGDMEWFVEGSAFYFMALGPYQHGSMEWEQFQRRTTPAGSEVVLTNNESYTAAARRGAPVLMGLDRRIRDATNNTRTLADVHRRLTDHERIDYEGFAANVTAVAGTDLRPWLDRHVDGNATVSPPAPGEFVPGGWTPAPGEHLYQCRDGTWQPLREPLEVGEPTAVAYTGFGDLRFDGQRRALDGGDMACSTGALPRDPVGPDAGVYTVVPDTDLTATVDYAYGPPGADTVEAVEATADDADARGQADDDGAAAETSGSGSSGPGFGAVAALVAVAGGVLILCAGRRR